MTRAVSYIGLEFLYLIFVCLSISISPSLHLSIRQSNHPTIRQSVEALVLGLLSSSYWLVVIMCQTVSQASHFGWTRSEILAYF